MCAQMRPLHATWLLAHSWYRSYSRKSPSSEAFFAMLCTWINIHVHICSVTITDSIITSPIPACRWLSPPLKLLTFFLYYTVSILGRFLAVSWCKLHWSTYKQRTLYTKINSTLKMVATLSMMAFKLKVEQVHEYKEVCHFFYFRVASYKVQPLMTSLLYYQDHQILIAMEMKIQHLVGVSPAFALTTNPWYLH